MHSGRIDTTALSGGIDLQATVESGQSYLWDREDGQMYETTGASGGDVWYWTVIRVDREPEVIRARQRDEALQWEASTDAEPHLRRLLGLEDDLPAIREQSPDDDVIEDAFDTYWGMRIVRDPPFPTLISFICSAQMRVGRIHEMQQALRREFGDPVEFDGQTYHAYPTPETLAEATEADLRELNLGYRAPYVKQSAAMVANGERTPEAVVGSNYEAAREALTEFVGVGQKVADCVLLFALGYLEAIPLDTWMQTVIEEFYPDCSRDSYEATSQALRERLGDRYAGYTQTYLFHYLRSGGRDL